MAGMQVTKALHCNLNARDLGPAVALYEAGLGLRTVMQSGAEGTDNTALGIDVPSYTQVSFLYDHRGGRVGPALEIMQWDTPALRSSSMATRRRARRRSTTSASTAPTSAERPNGTRRSGWCVWMATRASSTGSHGPGGGGCGRAERAAVIRRRVRVRAAPVDVAGNEFGWTGACRGEPPGPVPHGAGCPTTTDRGAPAPTTRAASTTTFYRRTPHGLEQASGKEYDAGDVSLMGADAVHSIDNSLRTNNAALHVFAGNPFTATCSQWDPATLDESPFDIPYVMSLYPTPTS